MKVALPSKPTTTSFPFRWSYIILPLAILLLSVMVTAFFYRQLPEEVAYRFQPDGSADGWLSRETITLGLLVPQFLFTLLAAAITLGISQLLRRRPPDNRINARRIIALMGNMLATPQLVLCFAMLSIFSYNSYRIYIMPLWVLALVITILGTIVLGLVFKSAIRPTSGKE